MNIDPQEYQKEKEYLQRTLSFLQEQLLAEYKERGEKEDSLIAYRREMYENASHHAQDFNKLSETVQYLNPLAMQTMDFQAGQQRIALYEKMEKAPYFARVDFETPRWGKETVYIGIGNLENEDTFETYVYDWRAPIASIFYRFELGEASYKAPAGTIQGEITLKRQYEISDGDLEFFFDSSVNIVDEILKEALRQNTSSRMQTIVETIQREQDLIIRDMENDLLIVQGVAGSGKTSIALHRAAYLMYQGLNGHLSASNMILISPNHLFAQYIGDVLPELGEENIETVTFENLAISHFDENFHFQSRNQVLEKILTSPPHQRQLLQDNLRFKSSPAFLEILNRLIYHYEHQMIPFADVMYEGKTIFHKELLKARFLASSSRSLPVQVRLQHIESIISDSITQRRPFRLKVLEDFMVSKPERAFDFKAAARLLHTKQVSRIMHHVRKFTRINFRKLYTQLFTQKDLFHQLSQGLELPENIEEIKELTRKQLLSGMMDYSDAMALFLLRLRMDTNHENIDIRQVVVDEAQDYSPVHFEILHRLYPSAKYTVLGDLNQTIVDIDTQGLYASIETVLQKKKSLTVSLNKSFRCSYEISMFASQFTDNKIEIEPLDRYEQAPKLIYRQEEDALIEALLAQLALWELEGYKTTAIICKNGAQAKEVYQKLQGRWKLNLFTNEESSPMAGTMIIPVYLAKGLEFNAVAVYGVDQENYNTLDDRRLLYISSTRALHRLSLFYTGTLSPLITPPDKFLEENK